MKAEYVRHLLTVVVPWNEARLAEIISGYLDVMDQLCLRHLGLKTRLGRVLSDGAPGLRVRMPLEGHYICKRPKSECGCGLDEDYYVESRPARLSMHKLYAVKSMSIPHSRSVTDANGKERFHRYEVEQVVPTLALFVEPLYKRGQNAPKTLTDDFVATEDELWEQEGKSMTLIDVETQEVLVPDVTVRCTGHNPTGKEKCENVMRFMIVFRPLSATTPQWTVSTVHLQCRECATHPFNVWEKDYHGHSPFETMHWEKQTFGLDRVSETPSGPRFISIA